MKLLETNPVPVVPLALQNLWGSYFSRDRSPIGSVNRLAVLRSALLKASRIEGHNGSSSTAPGPSTAIDSTRCGGDTA